MTEELRQTLERFDKETVEYLKMNQGEIFKSIAINEGIPKEIGATLVVRNNHRTIVVNAISELEKVTPK